MSKTIEIKKVHIRNLIISFVLGFVILYGLEHFGSFSYTSTYSHINERTQVESVTETYNVSSDKVSGIIYNTYFNSEIKTYGNGFLIYDFSFKDTDFNKYSVKSYYYTQAFVKDFKYGIYISLFLFSISLIFNNFKIKLS